MSVLVRVCAINIGAVVLIDDKPKGRKGPALACCDEDVLSFACVSSAGDVAFLAWHGIRRKYIHLRAWKEKHTVMQESKTWTGLLYGASFRDV